MGNLLSSTSRKYQLLIGSLPDDLPIEELKLYSLSQLIFDVDDISLGSVSESLGFKIVDKMELSLSKTDSCSNERKNESSESRDNFQSESSTVSISMKETFTLFYVLITDKPYYFSQTFSQWLTVHRYTNLCPLFCCRPEKRKIYLQPIENFPSCITDFEINLEHHGGDCNFFCLLQKFMEAYFDEMTANVLPDVNILRAKWNIKTRNHHKTGTKQYFVSDFFPRLKKVLPSDGYCVMGMSWTDLYPTEQLNFVLGEAHYAHRAGIFCFGRFEPKTFDPDTHTDITEINDSLMWRILKVSLKSLDIWKSKEVKQISLPAVQIG